MSAEVQLFKPNAGKLNQIALSLESYCTTSGVDAAETAKMIQALQRRPLLRFIVLRTVEDEMAAAGINWEGIGDFLVKIAPIIFELIKLFM